MSGGRFSYQDGNLKAEIFNFADKPTNQFEDMEISELVWDVLDLIHEYDWYASGDTSKEDYVKAKKEFKKKWLTTDRSVNLKRIIEERTSEVKEELMEML